MNSKYNYQHNLENEDIKLILAQYLNKKYENEPILKADDIHIKWDNINNKVSAYTNVVRTTIEEEI